MRRNFQRNVGQVGRAAGIEQQRDCAGAHYVVRCHGLFEAGGQSRGGSEEKTAQTIRKAHLGVFPRASRIERLESYVAAILLLRIDEIQYPALDTQLKTVN